MQAWPHMQNTKKKKTSLHKKHKSYAHMSSKFLPILISYRLHKRSSFLPGWGWRGSSNYTTSNKPHKSKSASDDSHANHTICIQQPPSNVTPSQKNHKQCKIINVLLYHCLLLWNMEDAFYDTLLCLRYFALSSTVWGPQPTASGGSQIGAYMKLLSWSIHLISSR